MLRGLALAAGTLALTAVAANAAAHPFPHVTGCVRADFRSAGTTVQAERCGPAHGARAVLVLHGCGGFDTFDHRLAAGLPRYGVSTLYVDYFGPTPPSGSKGFCGGGGGGADPFPTWERVAADAAAFLRPHFKHVGAVGWSLGAGVALTAAEDLHAFDAIASFSGIARPSVLEYARQLPPSIFLDGGRHDAVPPQDARALYAAAKRAHVATALYIYGTGTHNWPGAQGAAGIARAAAFLVRYLR
jgi:dienelactone hydrolase